MRERSRELLANVPRALIPGGGNSPVRALRARRRQRRISSVEAAAAAQYVCRRGRPPLPRLRRLVGPDDPRPCARARSCALCSDACRARPVVRRADRRSKPSSRRAHLRSDAVDRAWCAWSAPAPRRPMSAIRPRARLHRPRQDREVRGLLPRPHRSRCWSRRAPARLTLRRADLARRAEGARRADAGSLHSTTARRSSERVRRGRRADRRIIVEPIAGNMNCVLPAPGFLRDAARGVRRGTAACSSSTK